MYVDNLHIKIDRLVRFKIVQVSILPWEMIFQH